MKYKLVYLSTCNSNYFQGSSLPTVQVLVDGNTTVEMLREGLLSNITTEHLEVEPFEAYLEAVADFWKTHGLDNDEIFDSTLEIPTEDEEYDCYAYFGIEEVDTE